MILKYGDYKLRNIKNVNENKQEDEILIATNESAWAWEYDISRIIASLYLNIESGSLRLELIHTHIKTGIGAGKRSNEIYNNAVGSVDKPNLKEITSILAKNKFEKSSAGNGFKRVWVDVQSPDKEEKPLSVILATNRGVKTTKILRNLEEPKKVASVVTGGNKREKLAALHSKLWKLSDSDIDALLQKLSEGKTNENSLKNRLGGWIDGYVSINIDGNGDILGVVIDEIQKSINNIDGEGDIHLYINKNKVTESVEHDDIESSLKKGDKFEYVFLYDKGKKEEKITVVVDNPEKYMDEKDCEAEAIKRFKEKHGKDTEYDIIDK